MAVWQVQDAKARLSEAIACASSEGPQTITRHGVARAVVLSIDLNTRKRAPCPRKHFALPC